MARDNRSDDGAGDFPDYGDDIDPSTFEQILEMDDDGSREFSRELVYGFFDQAKSAFAEMEEALQQEDLRRLAELGHYLKGSSATLGLVKVRDSCERMQNLGQKKTATGEASTESDETLLRQIKNIIPDLKDDCRTAEIRLRSFYGHSLAAEEDD